MKETIENWNELSEAARESMQDISYREARWAEPFTLGTLRSVYTGISDLLSSFLLRLKLR